MPEVLPPLSAICVAPVTTLDALIVSGELVRPALVAVSVFTPATGPSVQLPTVAMPCVFVTAVPPVIAPPPVATAKVTVTPPTGLLFASRTSTLGGTATAVLMLPVVLPPFNDICVAAPAAPVAVIVSGEFVSPALVAMTVLLPATVPSVQLPSVAIPLAFDTALTPVIEPPPVPTEKVTGTPATGLPFASRMITLGGVATAAPAVPVVLPPLSAICVAAFVRPVAAIVSGEPPNVPLVAVIVLAPTSAPSVQDPTVAMPLAFVTCVAPVIVPPPEATAKLTVTPATGMLFTSRTITLGGTASAVPI